MDEILACRVCLATDARLFHMYKCDLVAAYEIITGVHVSLSDRLPLYACSFCSALLLKCVAFQERCRSAQDLLNGAISQNPDITTDHVRKIDRETNKLSLPYKHEKYLTIFKEEHISDEDIEPETNIKSEDDKSETGREFDEPTSYTSDEEPLSKTVQKRKQKKVAKDKKMKKPKSPDAVDFGGDDDYEFNFDNDNDVSEDIELINISKEEQLAEVEARKETQNYKTSFFKCDKCYKGYMTEATFNRHMMKHDPGSGREECDVCRLRCTSRRKLRAHMKTSHERQYKCRLCGYLARTSQKANEHSKWHTGFMYVCKVCGASFSKSTSYLTHARLRHPAAASACDECGESFLGDNGLRVHKRRKHEHGAPGSEMPCIKSEWRCSLCCVNFASPAALQKHVDSVCRSGTWSCVTCGDSFDSDKELRSHQKEHQQREPVKCVQCNKIFAHARSYGIHYRNVHLGLKYRSGRGGSNDGGDYAVCDVCGKTCISKATLVLHMRIHTGEKPYQCTECDKKFSIYQRLQIHVRTHTGECPFKCSHCHKAFKTKAALNRHDRVHTGVKPYACPHCGKTFSQSNSMKMHVRTVHLKLPAPYRQGRRGKDDHD